MAARLPHRRLSRRTFLTGSLGVTAGLVLAGCGDDGRGTSTSGAGDDGITALVRRFPPSTLVPGSQRVTVSVGASDGLLSVADAPSELVGRLLDEQGKKVIVTEVRANRHGEGLPAAYYPFELALEATGYYTLEVGDDAVTTTVDVVDPKDVDIPLPGAPLPPYDTPTTKDPAGVNPICTAEPPCPLHQITLTQALASGRPVAYLVGTPAYCQTAVCGPVLDMLVAEHEARGDAIAMVHSEVYTDSTIETVAPAVDAYHLTFEPVLFLADARGQLVERIDTVWDATELRAALDRIS